MKNEIKEYLKHTKLDTKTGCLNWTKCLNTDGYARALINGNANGKVHRAIYELTTKENITKKVVRHTCDNPICINPEHLISGTFSENMRDRSERERHGQAKLTHKEVLLIRTLYETRKYLQTELAEMFGVNHRTISSIICKTHFKHI